MNDTKIDYVTKSWNPVTGCLHGCEYCYARKIANRFGMPQPDNNCYIYTGKIKNYDDAVHTGPYPWGFAPTLHTYRLTEPQKIKKPQTIFVCSMADLFGDWVPDEWIQAVFKACEAAPRHRYLFLTKNPKRLCTLANKRELPQHQNFWYGTTINTQKDLIYSGRLFDNTFISVEPILAHLYSGIGSFGSTKWIIVGAETGNRKDKVVPKKEWIENIVETAKLTQASVFMKESLRTLMGEDFRQEFPWGVKV